MVYQVVEVVYLHTHTHTYTRHTHVVSAPQHLIITVTYTCYVHLFPFPSITHVRSRRTISISPDVIAVLDRSTNMKVVVFNVETGRTIGEPIEHNLHIVDIALSQARNDR